MKIIMDMPKGWMPGCCACCSVPDDAGCRDHGRECPLSGARGFQEDPTLNGQEYIHYAKSLAVEEAKDKTPKAKKGFSDEFKRFWMAYPKKIGKDKAFEAWKKKNPPINKCLSALEWQVKSVAWNKADPNTGEENAFIPHPSTYINAGRWDDIKDGHIIVKCSVCGEEGSLPKGVQGQPICRKCKEGAIAAQNGGI